jgi:hypothetical protein
VRYYLDRLSSFKEVISYKVSYVVNLLKYMNAQHHL